MGSGLVVMLGAISVVCVGCVAMGETEDVGDGRAASAMGWTSPPTTGLVSVVKAVLRANLFADSAVRTAESAEAKALEARDLAEH